MSKKKKQTKSIGNDEDYIHYLYKITNKNNSKYYHGIHSLPKDLGKTPENDGYWGSGTGIVRAIREEGRENFTKEVIRIFSTRKELSDAEESVVTIDEVRNPQCYNMIVGGDSNDCHLGWVVCRPKSAIDKVIKISREEYYKNRDLYVITGHLKYYKTGKGTPRKRTTGDKIKNAQKVDENDRMFSARNTYVNKDTLELKTFIGHDIPEDLYTVWFPHYFLDKNTNKFIDINYFKELYRNTSNLQKIASYLKTNRKKVEKLRDYYIDEGLDLSEYEGLRGHTSTCGFTNKRYINKDGEYKTIDVKDLKEYLSSGWKEGMSSLEVDRNTLINDFLLVPSYRKLSKKYKTTTKKLYIAMGISEDDPVQVWNKNGKFTKTKVSKELENRLIADGWKRGRK